MKVLVQRVLESKVEVESIVVGQINKGLLLFVGFTNTDTSKEVDYMVNKVINLRIFDDDNGVMNKSLLDVGGSILSVSQFTLYADASKGNRPSFTDALAFGKSEEYYKYLSDNPDKACHKVLVTYKKLVDDIKKPKKISFFNEITEEK